MFDSYFKSQTKSTIKFRPVRKPLDSPSADWLKRNPWYLKANPNFIRSVRKSGYSVPRAVLKARHKQGSTASHQPKKQVKVAGNTVKDTAASDQAI
jgi:hypothetical protein